MTADVNGDCTCQVSNKVLDRYRSRCISLNDVFDETGTATTETTQRLGGSLKNRLTCQAYNSAIPPIANIETPFSEGEIDISGLKYVEFITKIRATDSEQQRARIFISSADFDIIDATQFDVDDNTNN